MKRALLAGVALALLGGSAHAQIHRMQIYLAPPNPFPATQTIDFGQDTPVGLGGDPMQYATPVNLGLSRFLAITSMSGPGGPICTDYTTCLNASGPFAIDTRFQLVPKNGNGAYGTTWGSPTIGSYDVVVQEFFNSGGNGPTGTQTDITATITANEIHIREATSLSNGCDPTLVVCATVNVDAPTLTNQFNKVLNAGNVLGSETIKCRTGWFNPTGLGMRFRPPANIDTVVGRITITSEVVDNNSDANGNPRLENGCKIGSLLVDEAQSLAKSLPYDWTYLWFTVNQTGVTPTNFLAYTAGSGSGMTITHNRVEYGPLSAPLGNAPAAGKAFVLRVNDQSNYNHFVNVAKAISATGAGNNTIIGNIAEGLNNDFIDTVGCTNTVTDNFGTNWSPLAGNHVDSMQHLAAAGDPTCDYGTYARNIMVRNANLADPTGGDAQGGPFANSVQNPPAYLNNAAIWGNINILTLANSITLTYFNAPNVSSNTGLMVINSGFSGAFTSKLSVTAGKGGTDAVFDHNIFNAYATSAQGGTVTGSNNTLSATTGAYQAAYPSYVAGSNLGLVNPHAVSLMFTPSFTGTARHLVSGVWDGTFDGWATPADSAGQGCFNFPVQVFDPNKTCVQQGLTPLP